jgi:TRAP-type C4-dicarboxylate transport system permease small subunit
MQTTPQATTDRAGDEKLVDASGHFHLRDAPIDLSVYSFEAWIAFVFFWLLAADIFYQFFTRYALNSSASWTEEIARYLLICVVFIALAWAVRDNRHIHVDIFYRMLPAAVCRVLATLVDLVRIAFFLYAGVLTVQMMQKMGNYRMTIVDLPMNSVYGVCAVGRVRHHPFGAGRDRQLAARVEQTPSGGPAGRSRDAALLVSFSR